jgi:putative ATPase
VLAQATTYLATAPKSNASYLAVSKAMEDVEQGRVLPVPMHLRGTGYKGAERLGHKGYQYAHDFEGHFVVQDYAPTTARYYEPTKEGYEDTIGKRMAHWAELRRKAAECPRKDHGGGMT